MLYLGVRGVRGVRGVLGVLGVLGVVLVNSSFYKIKEKKKYRAV